MASMREAKTGKHDQAIRLFKFLKELTELRTKSIRTLDNYEIVLWLDKIPRYEGCFCAAWLEEDGEATDNWIELKKPRLLPPPEVSGELKPWLDPKQVADSSADYPELRDHIIESKYVNAEVEGKSENLISIQLSERPEIKDMWEQYVEKAWWPWAERDRDLKPVQEVYTNLFAIYQKQHRLGEMFEVVLGLGLLIWKTPGGQEVCRHLITAQASLDFDIARGIITVRPGSEGAKITLEQDMLEAAERPPADGQQAIEEQLQEIGDNIWDKASIEAALKSWINSVSSRGTFQSNLSVPISTTANSEPQVYFSPALILRKRNERNLIYVFQEIINQLAQENDLPVGIKSLIEYVVESEPDNQENSSLLAEDIYFPLQYNLEQQEIIRRLSTQHGVLVQGPPGTGKSQTIANLVCHLLANGKRVLVTSQAPRALKVLSRMIPDEVTSLCVSLLGYDRAALQGLEDCVFGITEKYNQWDDMDNQKIVEDLEKLLDDARRNEAETLGELKALREEETYVHTLQNSHYSGTLAAIAIRLREEEEKYSWIGAIREANEIPPLSNNEALELLRLLREINDDRNNEIQQKHVEPTKIIDPGNFLICVQNEKDIYKKYQDNEGARKHPAYPNLLTAEHEWRMILLDSVKELSALVHQLLQHPRTWAKQATIDILSGQEHRWRELWSYTKEQLVKIETITKEAAENVSGIDNMSRDSLVADATALLHHLEAGRSLGLGPFQPKVVRNGKYLIRSVYADGQPCSSISALQKLLKWLEREKLLVGLVEHWQSFEEVIGPLSVQVSTYKDFNFLLTKVITLQEKADILKNTIADVPNIKVPVWYDLDDLIAFQDAISAVSCEAELHQANEPFQLLESQLHVFTLQENAHSIAERLLNAVRQRNVQSYGEAYHFLCRLDKDAKELNKRNVLLKQLSSLLPELAESLLLSYEESFWDERLSNLEEAWHWANANRWLQEKTDPSAFDHLTGKLSYCQTQIKIIMKKLVEAKAWGHFFTRLEEEQRQHLMAWAASMRKIGKGTGKYAAQHRRNAREHMEQCRSAIPAWIMPIYRVAESVIPRINAFDVVIVDEASQSGPEALFLHYLAPKIIVVGDDKQISPEHVGVDREDVNILRERHIKDLPLSDMYSLEDSFFDQAVIRFGGRIRLKEHFRCMPEIIQFSNKICYQSEPLIPLRQRGAGRLLPVKVTHVPNGYRRGNGNRVENPPEADGIAEQIIKCCQDPTYADKTMGVISLQGDAQARLVEKRLLEKLGPEEMEKRQLICGDAYAFQGDERDIIFLSLVSAPDEARRIGTLSSDKDQRRFNVAASRAKDQMWLFHTATTNDLSMSCYRYRLLEYCLNPKVEPITFEEEIIDQDVLVHPFDSLFEQHVFCKIRERGFHVVPQYNVAGYRIDLVVNGMQGQLAVECDGDKWHGPEQYEADMERQRQLERCNWTFWRVRASTFYRDPDGAMESLWDKLEGLNIYPSMAKEGKKEVEVKESVAEIDEANLCDDGNDDTANYIQATITPENQGNVISLTDHRKIAVTEIHTNRLDYAKNTNNRDPVEKEGVTIHKVKEKQRHQGNAILDITRDCIQHISSYLNKNLIKFSKAIYRTSDNKTAVVCLTSRGIDKGESTKYWFGFRIKQKRFLKVWINHI